MSELTPESLLQSALEKIVYFEARSGQLTSDLEQARSEAVRLRGDVGQGAQREIELRRTLAELEVRLTRAHGEREETARLNEALRRERNELIGKVLEASRIQNASAAQDDGYDLAQFIATLRSEVASKPDQAQVLNGGFTGVMGVAEELQAQGRLTVSKADLNTLEANEPFEGRTEETLFGFSVRELSAPDAGARVRAAERLQALEHSAAAPALVAALHGERDSRAQVAMLSALAKLGGTEASAAVVPLASSASPEVRIAALRALLALDAPRAAPHLAAAMRDPDRAVRRRASLLALALSGSDAIVLGETAINDNDADVRALGALVLGASGSPKVRGALTKAMGDADVRVRRAAGQALSRLLGHDVTSLASLDEAQRRREVRRLAVLPMNPVRAAARSVTERLNAKAAQAKQADLSAQSVVRAQPVPVEVTRERIEWPAANGPSTVTAEASHPGRERPHVAADTQVTPSMRGPLTAAGQRPVSEVNIGRAAQNARSASSEANAVQGLRGEGDGAQVARTGSPVATHARHSHSGAGLEAQDEAHARGPSQNDSPVASSGDAPSPDGAATQQPEQASHHLNGHGAQMAGADASRNDDVTGGALAAHRREVPVHARPAAVAPDPRRAQASGHGSRVAVLEVETETIVSSASDGATLILTELQASLRGRPLDELSASVGMPNDAVQHLLAQLIASAQVVRRGHKYFVA